MKTNNIFSKIFKALALVSLSVFLVNCSKDNKSSTTNTGYVMQNGICYQNVNGQLIQQANTSLCYNSGNGYVMQNGLCYQNINGQLIQQANTSLCYTNTGSYVYQNGMCYQYVNGQYIQQANTSLCSGYNTGGYTTQVCNGYHTDGYQWVNCGVQFNCSGYTLMNQSGQITRCQ
ncbi:hypothetical protein AZI87_15755 [Bdellovibrio bacteriovorus]|uniref:Lipoprotein n=1 Tax=Bdellovibrio bacteriovorus TaxID=959 RepID=A0A161PQ27_BDEBC|nr:hypothetical protein [Bdellovibrio bacteriovorus]KYG62736.1 hypothetical protein AZI87_15755 [Bdellovibrio bacteriovorus]